MEHLVMNRNGLAAHVTNIGCQLGDEAFLLQEDACESLQTIWTLLSSEDPNTLPVRRHLGALGFGPKILVPLLQHVFSGCNEDVEDRESVFLVACQFLVALTEPLSVLVKREIVEFRGGTPGVPGLSDPLASTPCSTIEKDMALMLQEIRAEFQKLEIHQALFNPLLSILRKTDDGPLTSDEISAVNCMLYIYRNLLTDRSQPNENLLIVGLMFQGGLQECCHLMFSRPEMNVWVVAFVQLLPIIYCNECDLLISEADSSSVSGEGSKTLMEELSGYTDRQNINTAPLSTADSVSTSLDQDSVMMIEDEKKDDKSKESAEEGSRGKSIVSELFRQNFEKMDDALVDNLMILLTRKNLRVLAEEFIQHAFPDLLYVLKGHLLCGNSSNLSATYMGWVIHYFLSVSKNSVMPFGSVKEIISFDMVGFLVYKICMLQESLLTNRMAQLPSSQSELEMCVKGLASIIEYIYTFPTTGDQRAEDVEYIKLVKSYLADMANLGEMFVFLLCHCSPGPGSPLLSELILLNHKFLLLAESADKEKCLIDVSRHVENFATPDLLRMLFSALDVNVMGSADCRELVTAVFTMAYHVVVDHGRVDCIAQPAILATFCALDDDRLLDSLSSEHIDLVNHVLRLLFGEADDESMEQVKSFDSCVDSESETETGMETGTKLPSNKSSEKNKSIEDCEHQQNGTVSASDWNDEEVSNLMDAYMKCSSGGVKEVLAKLRSEKLLHRSSFQVLYKLLTLEMLSEADFTQALSDVQDPSMAAEVEEFILRQEEQQLQQLQEEKEEEEEEEMNEPTVIKQDQVQEEDKENIMKSTQLSKVISEVHRTCPHQDIQWLQQQLMEACFVKCGGRELGKPFAEEPLYLYSSLSHQRLPIPVLTDHQVSAVSRPAIQSLLKLIGCDLESGLFPRLPAFASPVELYLLIKRLGPVDNIIEKVEETDLVEANMSEIQVTASSEKLVAPVETKCSPMATSEDMSSSMWPQIVYMFNNSLKVK